MPELPEVETIARGLAPLLTGRRVAGLTVLDRRVFQGDPGEFEHLFSGRAITRVFRRAKLCLVEVEGGALMAFHLKMTGRLFVTRPGERPEPHLRVLVALDDGRALHFTDMRRFGSCRGFAPGAIESWDFYASLGPEPLELDAAGFRTALAGRGGRIKAVLLDQKAVAGVGNIYADESLFLAGIRPDAKADRIPAAKLDELFEALRDVLSRAIESGGSTIRDYRSAEGVEGSFQWTFNVYGRAGEPCTVCGRALTSQKVAGRTSTFCARCQRASFGS
ncbi:bifunctional DNA-formamidopyrimidine glycosylase/DNA-(apurinic or apyrimidinic site) lyase [Fundidesulfovibrio terrae]|uniref:bifunctional DNA-formamidopyrimidine glycosylase/DNA-(apurinic or apyrimidinic site) lyase n=1 Tax=Fundidesulfovibrio terrae TaxID=2922866 RepID=UPI001FB044BD|nr:bifunctional DNA-formamidopyrimidine glycosylase/DNA-(apurinic or apyrimidinic site) lyase [Fundidesulfovibrio terrae]